jgi:hypothetical protein
MARTRHENLASTSRDHKWFTRLVVADIIHSQLKELNLNYPKVSEEKHQELLQAKAVLESQ